MWRVGVPISHLIECNPSLLVPQPKARIVHTCPLPHPSIHLSPRLLHSNQSACGVFPMIYTSIRPHLEKDFWQFTVWNSRGLFVFVFVLFFPKWRHQEQWKVKHAEAKGMKCRERVPWQWVLLVGHRWFGSGCRVPYFKSEPVNQIHSNPTHVYLHMHMCTHCIPPSVHLTSPSPSPSLTPAQ